MRAKENVSLQNNGVNSNIHHSNYGGVNSQIEVPSHADDNPDYMGIGVLQQPSKQINYLLQVNSPSNINPAHPSDANGPQNYNNIDKLTEQQ